MSTRTVFATLAALSIAATASGQGLGAARVDNRPFRGIFGSPASPDSPQSLTVAGSLFGAYDDSQVDGLLNPATGLPWVQRSGAYYGANAGLDYAFQLQGTRYSFSGTTTARVDYYDANNTQRVLPTYRGDAAFSARLTRSLTFAAQQSVAYLSTYNSLLTPRLGENLGHDIGLLDDPTQDVFELKAIRSTSTATLTNRFGQYLFASGAYHYRTSHVVDDGAVRNSRFFDYGSHAGSATVMYARPFTRHATLQLGYAVKVTDSDSRAGEPEVLHTINAGVNYGRALSFSRRTTLSFSTGSAIAAQDRATVPDGNPTTRVQLIGTATLAHQIGQTWTAQLDYWRGFRFHEGFDDLYFSDSVNASFGGLLTRKLSFDALGAWARSSLMNQRGAHRGRSATARLQYALTSFVAVYAQYLYHYYRFTDDVQIDGRLPRQLDRHGARAGVALSVPLIR